MKNEQHLVLLKELKDAIIGQYDTIDNFCRCNEGFSKSTVSLHLSGKRVMGVDKLFKYYDAIGVLAEFKVIGGYRKVGYIGSLSGGHWEDFY